MKALNVFDWFNYWRGKFVLPKEENEGESHSCEKEIFQYKYFLTKLDIFFWNSIFLTFELLFFTASYSCVFLILRKHKFATKFRMYLTNLWKNKFVNVLRFNFKTVRMHKMSWEMVKIVIMKKMHFAIFCYILYSTVYFVHTQIISIFNMDNKWSGLAWAIFPPG